MKSNLLCNVPLFLLTVLSPLPPGCARDQTNATNAPPTAQASEASALTLADLIAPALRDNRSLMDSACGVEGQAFSLRRPGPDLV